ncbi:MAG: hypothetical protein IPK85_09925 [Gemmatimonadetes bacterium]|nr:hypothetical protein [Gemmatimonadota bacterium]
MRLPIMALLLAPAGVLAQSRPAWEPDSLGNHRAVVQVNTRADAVLARLDWRRRDKAPEEVQVVVIDAATNRRVVNAARVEITREFGEIVFQPPTVPGTYYIYYLPYTGTFQSPYPKLAWRTPDDAPQREWLLRNALTPDNSRFRGYRQLPPVQVLRFESSDAFSTFTDMERVASRSELDALRQRYSWAEFFLFSEDRNRPIRMFDEVPQRWAVGGPFQAHQGNTDRGEYYTFQVGVWAHRAALPRLAVEIDELRGRKGGVIPRRALTCFNVEGIDWAGQGFSKAISVAAGRVQPLWFGVDVDSTLAPDVYEGDVTISAEGVRPQKIRVALTVGAALAVNHGDDEPSRLTRLRWLNSQLAANDELVAPFTPMTREGRRVGVLGRQLTVGLDGMPEQVTSTFTPSVTSARGMPRQLLAAPMRLDVTAAGGRSVEWQNASVAFGPRTDGVVTWQVQREGRDGLTMDVQARMEFDGTAEYQVSLRAREATSLGDVRLVVPLRADAARYMMGLGQPGGRRPGAFHWTWDVARKNQDAVWLGDVNTGVQVTLKDESYVRPLNTNFYLSKPLVLPRSWGNGGRGGCDLSVAAVPVVGPVTRPRAPARATPDSVVTLSCFSGQHSLAAGETLRFDMRFALTPFKPIDTDAQWATRYFHAFVPVDSIAGRGANTVNVHHANRVNPWINYPFLEPAQMKAYVDSAHARRMKAKIYYTVREITNHAPELWAIRSLGDEVLARGPGGGGAWLMEHGGDDYLSAWHVAPIRDAALVTSGVSRWHNFYVEGLDWLVKHVGIDGLYIDDVAFDRTTMKRVRRVLDQGNRGALIDLHSANQFNVRDGFASSANLYLEHFPFINRLWFGEYFDYNSNPDYWLVELSGIPFGLMGEMLEKGGHPWRGMTFGMTNRMPWSGDPAPLWALWDAFGMTGSRMVGWWAPDAPIVTGDTLVLATTYLKPGRALVALGNWSSDSRSVRLRIDWPALGIQSRGARIAAPAVREFQEAGQWAPGDPITVPGGKGLLLEVTGTPVATPGRNRRTP